MAEQNMTQHFILTVFKIHHTFQIQIMSQEHEKAIAPFPSHPWESVTDSKKIVAHIGVIN